MNIDMLRRELPIQFLLSLKARGKFPEFNVQVIRDRASHVGRMGRRNGFLVGTHWCHGGSL